jgi:hypothetical protein
MSKRIQFTDRQSEWLKSLVYKEIVYSIQQTKKHLGTKFAENHYLRAQELLVLLKKLIK